MLYFISVVPLFAQNTAFKALLNTIYEKDFPVIYPEELADKKDWVVLDARELREFEVSHLPHSIWVGYEAFDLSKVEMFNKDQPIVVYCTVGYRSQKVGEQLRSAGFREVYNLYGGIIHWVNESNPVYKNQVETEEVHVYSRTWGIWLQKGVKIHD